ncbi:MAG: WD40/YVTN/BNR-like repeat-containing protein, partial [Rhodanobacteraceae bacterium]
PEHPDYMITAADQGTVVSVDGGRTWSSWYNQPTGQFYHLAADNRFPYWVYSGQQDSGTVGIASRSDYGALSFRDWHPVGGDERDYDVPDPIDPLIVYGTGLGGRLSRFDARTGQVANVSPWPITSYGAKPDTTKYRYTWITPMLALRNRKGQGVLYFGAQVLFRSTDRGDHWDVISPDLTGQDPDAKHCGGKVAIADARACGYGVIYSIAVSPRDDNEIWTGSDSGMIFNTRDGGAHWNDVTPQGIATMTKVSSLDVSALRAGTIYAAADNHRHDDFAPHVWRTHDFGKTWTEVDTGLLRDHYVSVVRADPVRAGLLYAGTDAGAFVSFDDGDHWQPLQMNLPTVWVRDLLVHDDDLIAATQGRAIWVLDDLSPLRQWNAAVASQPLHLFKPADALRVHFDNNKDTPLPPETPLGKNPPAGAIIDYSLGANTRGPVTIDILDASGKVVIRHFSSDAKPEKARAERYFDADWLQPEKVPAAAPGLHRFVWNLRHARPRAASYDYSIAAVFGEDTPTSPQGAFVLPGQYMVVLKANGREQRQPLIVKMDPRVQTSTADLRAAFAFTTVVNAALDASFVGYAQQKGVSKQLDALSNQLGDKPTNKSLRDEIASVQAKLQPPPGETLDQASDFTSIGGQLAALESDAESADTAPTVAQQQVLAGASDHLETAWRQWRTLQSGELAKLNADLKSAGMKLVNVPPKDKLDAGEPDPGQDLP